MYIVVATHMHTVVLYENVCTLNPLTHMSCDKVTISIAMM